MSWLEVIELRSPGNKQVRLEELLRKLVSDFAKLEKKTEIRAYTRMNVETDTSILLFHKSKDPQQQGSQIGLLLTSILKEFGYVSHRIWTELNG